MSTLFINACIKKDSKTLAVAKKLLKDKLKVASQVVLQEQKLVPLNSKTLAKRDKLLKNGQLNHKSFNLANQFANASEIIIATPFWDLAFPSLLKIYLENITVGGITFCYDNGIPKGLCKAKKLIFITTAGGKIFDDFGFSYIKSLATNLFGIKQVEGYKVENTDVLCLDSTTVLQQEIIKMN